MLAATDFDIAGVGQEAPAHPYLQLPRGSVGKVSQRWWQGYERYLQVGDGEVDVFDATGNPPRFTAKADGAYTTPVGYSKDLKKNADGTYTLTDRKSGTKDTYNEHGTLTKVTDKNDGTITVDQHDEGSDHKGLQAHRDPLRPLDRPGQDGREPVAGQGPHRPHRRPRPRRGRQPDQGDGHRRQEPRSTSTSGSRPGDEGDHPRGRTVTLFTYDGHNRVTSCNAPPALRAAVTPARPLALRLHAATPADARHDDESPTPTATGQIYTHQRGR
ncbi:hypothetical protein LV779_02810 [Streptomyces thinghirensis]|nr:hypothetical protein [Streptomyces thinghirensis]